ncbi:MAG TPA: hypothetical protein VGD46_15815 [Rhizobacter sp.]
MSRTLFSQFATDKNIEQEGILLNYGDVRFRVARAGGANRRYNTIFKQKSKPVRRQMDNENLDEKVGERLLAETYAEAVILSIESHRLDADGNPVFDADGEHLWDPTFFLPADKKAGREKDEVLPFTVENTVKILLALPELFADIREQAMKLSNFLQAQAEEDAKN